MAKQTVIDTADLPVEVVPTDSLTPHPRNYRKHPEDQLDHIRESIREHGFYRPVVIASDGTILAGHGLWEAAVAEGYAQIPTHQTGYEPDSPAALKILTADNELSRFAETDDRLLSELLREIKREDPAGLAGTGYDDMMLANLVMVTRPASEIQDFDEAAHWVGMPEYEPGEEQYKLVVTCATEEDRDRLCTLIGSPPDKKMRSTWSTRFPWSERKDGAAFEFQLDEDEE